MDLHGFWYNRARKGGRAVYYVYILRCEGGSLYTGITTDPARRLRQHKGELSGGAKFTAWKKPLGYAAVWTAPDRSAASRLEARIKRLTHAQKEALIAGTWVPDWFQQE